ncbi:hypothetical protein OH807_01610 [Kitasatospora sp. NBC_01560]|uniref:hypothetical protein n=1 Tax=Kitasatospora sp. NBC_01560 TaxID=2975965 RepID=UPI003863B8A2
MTWVVRACAVGAWAVLTVALVRAFRLGGGAVQPPDDLLALGWTGVGLLRVRAATLWAGRAARRRVRARTTGVRLAKGTAPSPARPATPTGVVAASAVYVRQAAVWCLLPLAAALPGALREVDGGEAIRELKAAGAVVAVVTVAQVTHVDPRECRRHRHALRGRPRTEPPRRPGHRHRGDHP